MAFVAVRISRSRCSAIDCSCQSNGIITVCIYQSKRPSSKCCQPCQSAFSNGQTIQNVFWNTIFISIPKIDENWLSILTDAPRWPFTASGLLVYIIARSFHQVNISEIGNSQSFPIEFGSLSTTVLVFQSLFCIDKLQIFKYPRETSGR